MQLPKFSLNNFQFVIVAVLLAILSGVLSYLNMKRSEDPMVKGAYYAITAIYPGTSPKDMEELVVDPIEEAINELEDIVEIKTTVQEGLVVMRIEGTFGIDTEDKLDEIKSEVSSIRGELPEDIYKIEVKHLHPAEVKILQLAITSDEASYHKLKEKAEDLEDALERVSGVRTVEIEAYPEEEVRIALDFQKMSQQHVALNQVINILSSNNRNLPGGSIDSGNKSFTIKTSGSYKTIEELNNTVIAANGEKIVYLKDIANIQYEYEDVTYKGRFNQKKAVFLTVTQKENDNILRISEDLNKEITTFQQNLNGDIEVAKVFEQAPAVSQRIDGFMVNLGQGIILIGIIVIVFLGFRSALVVMTVIPATIFIAISILDMSDYGLHQISIIGLVIALGLLVDNAIVVVENITRYLNEGHSLRQAAIKGTNEVGWALIGSTATTVLSFLPLALINNDVGEFIRSMPLIVVYCLVLSLILALTFTPILAGKFIKLKPQKKEKTVQKGLNFVIEKFYRKSLQFGLQRPVVVLGLALFTFFGGIALFPLVGVSLFPVADKPLLLIDIETPEGSSLDNTDKAAHFVESVLDTMPIVTSYGMNVGHGNPRIYYNRFPKSIKKNYAQVIVNLTEWDEATFYPTIKQLRKDFENYPGARITLSELKQGVPVDAPIVVKVYGDDLNKLKEIAFDIEQTVEETEGVINSYNPLAIDKVDIKVNINKDKAGLIGLPLQNIDLAVRAGLTGIKVDEMTMDNGENFDIVVRMPFGDKPTLDDFNRIYTTTMSGKSVPLSQTANIEFAKSASQIDHYNLERTATITASVLDDYNVIKVTEAIIAKLENYELPEGYKFHFAGEYEKQQESFGDLGQKLLMALIAIFAVLVLQFKSFRQPLIVFSAIPLAFTGSIVALFITGWTFSFFAFVGFTSLVGIVINTSIILIDYTNQLRIGGMDKTEAIIKACETRFLPIVLTSCTTIFGLLPLTLSKGDLWPPLGWTIIGGMVSSTFLTLLVVPVLYKLFSREKLTDDSEEELVEEGIISPAV